MTSRVACCIQHLLAGNATDTVPRPAAGISWQELAFWAFRTMPAFRAPAAPPQPQLVMAPLHQPVMPAPAAGTLRVFQGQDGRYPCPLPGCSALMPSPSEGLMHLTVRCRHSLVDYDACRGKRVQFHMRVPSTPDDDGMDVYESDRFGFVGDHRIQRTN